MQRTAHHPDQLTLQLGFIRRILCAGAPLELSSETRKGTGQSGRKTESETGQNDRNEGEDAKKSEFTQALVRARKTLGFSQADAAQSLQIGERTFRRWEKGEIEPKKALQKGIVDALRSCRKPPGEAKLEQIEKVHHLDWEKGKGWRLRVTVDVGKKVVGKRISLRLGSYTLEEAIQRKKLTLNLLAKLGLTVRQRVQRRLSKAASG